MDSLSAFARGEASRGNPVKVFDWTRAAELIKTRKAQNASAGLSEDWEWTGGAIYRDGEIVPQDDTYTYLASRWATPELEIDNDLIDCWRYQSDTPEWDAQTYWPDEAREVLAE